MMNIGCKNCKDRQLGCHANCEKYKKFQKETEEINKNRKKYIKSYSSQFRANNFTK